METLPVGDEWTTIQVSAGEGVALKTNAFVPGGYDPRLLGTRVLDVSAERTGNQATNEPHR